MIGTKRPTCVLAPKPSLFGRKKKGSMEDLEKRLGHVPEMIVVTDACSHVVFCSSFYLARTGFLVSDVVGQEESLLFTHDGTDNGIMQDRVFLKRKALKPLRATVKQKAEGSSCVIVFEELVETELVRFKAAVEVFQHILWFADATGQVYYFNKAFESVTGVPREQCLGLSGASLIHAEDRENVLAKWTGGINQKRAFEYRFRMLHMDKTYHHFYCSAQPVIGSDGEIEAWFGSTVDLRDHLLG